MFPYIDMQIKRIFHKVTFSSNADEAISLYFIKNLSFLEFKDKIYRRIQTYQNQELIWKKVYLFQYVDST